MVHGANTVSMGVDSERPTRAYTLEEAVAVFVETRPRLFGIAYRMLGSVTEAEDVLQEAWVRWQRTDRSAIANPSAFLALTTTRLSINVIQSARSRRETYSGQWLPEPVDTSADPALGAERAEALEFACLLLMERLAPAERAAYVLREAFVYPYEQIAEVLEISAVYARQLVSRARKHLRTAVAGGAERRRDRRPVAGRRVGLSELLMSCRSLRNAVEAEV